ncbi:MAG: peptide-methionine (S)-S-oxide reductase MsrA [Bacteroidales bacterium]|nr:peptide-methionine (S)-S-oxide reductase MsrA [Bacteroidales bacterium]
MKEIYLAGGCFWGAEHYFRNIEGVVDTEVGFANGDTPAPTYDQVYTDTTGYAETVRVIYNPDGLPLDELLRAFFCAIDPLSLNKQGEDEGTRYRTGIYYTDSADLPIAKKVFEEIQAEYSSPLAVELLPLKNFFVAEGRHQDYLVKNPDGYCHLPIKIFRYPRLVSDLRHLLGDEPDLVARLSNAAALIKEKMGFFWAGFYLVGPSDNGKELILGPFQGSVACMRIGYGRGVCGTAWKEARTVVVPDVEEFPGHIACSSLSRSEIVVPIERGGEVTGVLDIDSAELSTFDHIDAFWLERLVRIL